MRTNFSLIQHHKWSLADLNNMIAWERQVYVALLMNYLREENERKKLERMSKR